MSGSLVRTTWGEVSLHSSLFYNLIRSYEQFTCSSALSLTDSDGMKGTWTRLAGLCLSGICFAGCATARPKPAGFTDPQLSQTLRHLRTLCMTLRLGSPVNVKFYEGASATDKDVASASMTGYFYAYNKWNDTITISPQPPAFFDRGTPFYLASIQSIAPTETASVKAPGDYLANAVIGAAQQINTTLLQANAPAKKSVFMTASDLQPPHDFEHDLLTQ